MRSFLLALAFAAVALPAQHSQAAYKYATSLTIAAPSGSAGATLADGLPKSIKISPCSSTTALDQFTFSLKYDAGKLAAEKRDVYLIFYRADAAGSSFEPKFFPIVKRFPGPAHQVAARGDIRDLNDNKLADIYVTAANNLGGAITETVLGGNIILEGLPAGLWMAMSIIADSATIDFDDPATWLAWDAVPFLLRKPWEGSTNNVCQ